MKVLLVTYDLKQSKESYTNLYAALKTAPYWWHYIESTWLLATEQSPKDWYAKLASTIFNTDRLLIIEVAPNYWGWLSNDAWDWIKKNLG
jgi:hypothetical protein